MYQEITAIVHDRSAMFGQRSQACKQVFSNMEETQGMLNNDAYLTLL